MKKYDGIIFDLDGTMWSSTKPICECWNIILKRHPEIEREPITMDELGDCMGLVMYDIAAKLFPNEEETVRNSLMDELCAYENEYLAKVGGELYPQLEETLAELKKTHRLFIVSNCQDGYIESFLTAHAMGQYFEDTECWGRTLAVKAVSNRILMERNGLKNPVYVGDTAGDAKAAKDAGIDFIFAKYGFGTVDEDLCVASIATFAELLDLI